MLVLAEVDVLDNDRVKTSRFELVLLVENLTGWTSLTSLIGAGRSVPSAMTLMEEMLKVVSRGRS